MMTNKAISVCYVLIVISSLYMMVAAQDVVTQNLKLFVEGKEFFIKGMCYSPAPLGQGVVNNGVVGGGFCSPKMTPYGQLTTSCYDSDYFDGSGDVATRPQTTEGGWFQPVWERDFPMMKALGVNTLRLYSANPTTKQASMYYPELVPFPVGKDHVPFMDMAASYGFKVIFPLIADYGMMTTYTTNDFKRLLRWQIDEVGNHPALLMWGFGNELPLDAGNSQLVAMLNMYITFIKQYTMTKWGRKVPVTTAVVDLPNSYDYLAATLDVDIFTTNAGYRGTTFTDLFSGNGVTQGWRKLSCTYNKPVFIGEMGWMSQDNAITYQNPTWFNQMYKDLVSHINDGCIGGAFFEYSDEQGKADVLQKTMGLVKFDVNVTGGYPSTEDEIWSADKATPKAIIYDAVRAGSYNGVPYNMNSDAFSLAGITQSLLGSTNAICSAYNLLSCPGTQNTCSFHGVCNRMLGTCSCVTGWTGPDCSQPSCPNSCSGRGTCTTSVSPPVCNCQDGWTGAYCQSATSTYACAANCVTTNGKCDPNGKCICLHGWMGNDCSLPDISYPPTSGSTPAPTKAPTQPPTQPATQAPTQPATQAPTQPATQAPTQPATQAPTQAPTQKPTQPATQAPTQPATQAPTQAPTQKPTQPATQAPTQAPTQAGGPNCSATMRPCGQACYDPSSYNCFDGFLCPLLTSRCGFACYNPTQYSCPAGQLIPL